MNLYARLSDLKSYMGIAGTTDDARNLLALEAVSRAWDRLLGQHFYARSMTEYVDGNGRTQIWLPAPVASITTLTVDDDGNDTWEITLAADTDYWTWPNSPESSEPILRLDLNDNGTQISVWPRRRRSIKIVGFRGYSNETEAAGTLGAAITTTSTTSVTMTTGSGLSAGDTIVVGTEQMYVSAFAEGVATDVLTVVRGVNGTTAATALNAAAVTRRRFPRDLELATIMQTSRLVRDAQSGFSGSAGGAEFGAIAFNSLYPVIRDMLAPFRRLAVA